MVCLCLCPLSFFQLNLSVYRRNHNVRSRVLHQFPSFSFESWAGKAFLQHTLPAGTPSFLLRVMPVPWGVAPRVNFSVTGLGLPACRHGSDQRLVLTPLTHGSHTPLLRAVPCSSSPTLDSRDASSIWLLKTSTSPDSARRPQGTNPRVAEAPGGLVKAQRRARQSAHLAHSQQRWSGDHAWRTTIQTIEGPVMEPRVPLKLLSHCSRGVNR